jgi:general secretion pathway protein K
MRRGAKGAALLTALIIVSVVATIAAAMVWQQWRAVQVESAERARTQSAWILAGALDWARLILREDGRSASKVDHLGEPWAVPLAEARLSSFLAAEAQATEDAPDAFLSGSITDANARLNLANLIDVGRVPNVAWTEALQRLCRTVGVSEDVASRIVAGLRAAAPAAAGAAASGASAPPIAEARDDPPLAPQTVEQLAWLGIEPEAIRALEPYVTILNGKSNVNVNTASREVLASVIKGLDVATAERMVQVRQRTPFKSLADIQSLLGVQFVDALGLVDVQTSYFEVRGRLRLEAVVLEQRSLVQRVANNAVRVVRRERVSTRDTDILQTTQK